MIKLFATMLCLSSLAAAASADLAVRKAYYRDTNLSIHLFLENKGDQVITPLPPVVNGFDTATLGRDGKTAGAALWYRCRPNPIPPGGIADLTITLAERPAKPEIVEIPTASGQRIRATIPCAPEPIRFQAIRFSPDLRTVYVYLRWSNASSEDSIKTIRMDGVNVSKSASPRPSRSIDGLAYTRISLAKPLDKGSYHVFEPETESGLSTAYQIRAIPAEFLIGVYGSLSEENMRDWAAHGCNHFLSFGAVPPDQFDTMKVNGLSVGARYIPQHLADRQAGNVLAFDEDASRKILQGLVDKPGLLYHSLVDEPDAGDYYVGRRLGASSMELIARDEFCRKIDPMRYVFVQLDNTFRPRNYSVYGEAADVLATHRYSLGSFIRGEAGATTVTRLSFLEDMQETLSRFRDATAPKPFFMVTQFFDLGAGRQGRAPTIEEMRLQCYAMVAGGARGLIHYIHSGSGGGHEGGKTPALWDAMTALHAELKRVGEVVESGTPVPDGWIKTGSANVYASAVLSGNKMAVILINRAHRSEPGQFTARPTRDIDVSLRIPPWIDASRLKVVPADTSKPVSSTVHGNQLTFNVDEVKDARCFLLTQRIR